MADYIAEKTGAYEVEIEAEVPYTGSYNDVAYGRAREEWENNARPAVSGSTYDKIEIEKYRAVFVGFPVWWHTAPMIIGTFLEHYNWHESVDIYPFFQGASNSTRSYYDNSMQFIRTSAAGATVHDGLYSSPSDTARIDEYLETEYSAPSAFRRADGITKLVIPVSVTSIGNYFIADSTITSIRYAGTAAQWESVAKGKLWNLGKTDITVVFEAE